MQCIYALTQSKDDSLEKQEKFLKVSIENMYTLYLLMLSLFVELHERAENQISLSSKKYLKNSTDSYPNKEKFLNNKLLQQIAGNKLLRDELSKRKLNNWYLNEDYIRIIYNEVMESDIYAIYMSNADTSYEEDKRLVIDLF